MRKDVRRKPNQPNPFAVPLDQQTVNPYSDPANMPSDSLTPYIDDTVCLEPPDDTD